MYSPLEKVNPFTIVGAVMSEKGVRCFFRGKSNLKTVLESLRGIIRNSMLAKNIFHGNMIFLPVSMATMKFKGAITKSTISGRPAM